MKGRFGWAVDGVEVGDVVVVLRGCDFPLTLRSDGEEAGYRILGDCYLDGVMEGQAVADDTLEGLELTIV